MNSLPRVSIITVVYNSASLLQATIDSVAAQTYANIEYLIIDGGSTDGTIDIIKKNAGLITRWISEPDRGIYDAMNKGLQLATGDYVWFINSGDRIFSVHTLQNVMQQPEADIYYGETEIINREGYRLGDRRLKAPEQLSWKSFINGMLVCHQSVIIKKSITKSYNLNYKVSADFDWVLYALRRASTIHNTRLVLSKYLEEGTSRSNIKRSLRERFKIMTSYYGLLPVLIKHVVIAARFFAYWLRHGRF